MQLSYAAMDNLDFELAVTFASLATRYLTLASKANLAVLVAVPFKLSSFFFAAKTTLSWALAISYFLARSLFAAASLISAASHKVVHLSNSAFNSLYFLMASLYAVTASLAVCSN